MAADFGIIYDKLDQVYQKTGLKCTVDSACRCKNIIYLLKSMQDDMFAHGGGLDQREALKVVRKECIATYASSFKVEYAYISIHVSKGERYYHLWREQSNEDHVESNDSPF